MPNHTDTAETPGQDSSRAATTAKESVKETAKVTRLNRIANEVAGRAAKRVSDMTGSTKFLQLSLTDEITRGKVADQASSVGRHFTCVDDHPPSKTQSPYAARPVLVLLPTP
jgi:hypothetical protein